MQTGHAALDQSATLLGGVLNSKLSGCGIILTDAIQFTRESLGDAGTAHGRELADLGSAENRNDAWDHGNGVPESGEMISKAEEVVVVEEQLCDDKVGAAIDFPLQPFPIDFAAFLTSDMAFWKSCGADTKPAP